MLTKTERIVLNIAVVLAILSGVTIALGAMLSAAPDRLEDVESTTETTEPTETTETTAPIEETEPTDETVEYTEPTETIAVTESVEPTESLVTEPVDINLGEFKLTAYCPCSECNGEWAGGITATGVMAESKHTIAVDPTVIPYGTEVIINGHTYVAEDCGGAIKGNRIDIYFDTHEEALEFGVRYADVYIVGS